MLPLSQWREAERRAIRGVFTDIDDTLTEGGAVQPQALQALHGLAQAGLMVIPVTGRPVGWCEERMAAWPVPAALAENGAVGLLKNAGEKNSHSRMSSTQSLLSKIYQTEAEIRAQNFARLQQVAQQILAQVPGTTLARDSAGRETDIAIDHSEFASLSPVQIEQVVALMRAAGMNASVSSIHINGWYGAHDKWQGACWLLQALYQRDLRAELAHWVYVGDSANDQIMFQYFQHSVGVANIAQHVPAMQHLPRYVTQAERGQGFAELAQVLLSALA